MNKKAFKKILIERGKTNRDVTNILGITAAALSMKLSGKTDWKLKQIKKLQKGLNLTNKEVIRIFLK